MNVHLCQILITTIIMLCVVRSCNTSENVVPESDEEALLGVFKTFCGVGAGNNDSQQLMGVKQFNKLFKNLDLYDKKFTSTDADIIFNKVSESGAKINFEKFKKALELCAEYMYTGKGDYPKVVDRIVSGKGPDTTVVPESDEDALLGVFKTFSDVGDGNNDSQPLMGVKHFKKLFKELDLYDKKFTSADADIIFSKVSESGAKINFEKFKKALELCAEDMYTGKGDYPKLVDKIVSGKGPDTTVVPESDEDALLGVFKTFCGVGAGNNDSQPLMGVKQFKKLFKNLDLYDNKLTSTDAKLIFNKVSESGAKINFEQFKKALELCAEFKYTEKGDYQKLVDKIVSGKGPDTSVVPGSDEDALLGVFKTFCGVGAGINDSQPLMGVKQFNKLFKDLDLYDKNFTSTDADIIFNRVSESGAKINFEQFKKALELCAEVKYTEKGDYQKLFDKIVNGKGPDTSVVPGSDEDALQEVFKNLCGVGAGNDSQPLMGVKQFNKLFKDLDLYDKNFTSNDTDNIFNRPEVKPSTERKINFEQFKKALELCAEKKYGSKDDYQKLVDKICSGKTLGPMGATKTVKAGGVDRLTNTSFDESGIGIREGAGGTFGL